MTEQVYIDSSLLYTKGLDDPMQHALKQIREEICQKDQDGFESFLLDTSYVGVNCYYFNLICVED